MKRTDWFTALHTALSAEPHPDRLNEVVRENLTQADVEANWDQDNPRWTRNVQALAAAAEALFGRRVDVMIEGSLGDGNESWLDVTEAECAEAAKEVNDGGDVAAWFGCEYQLFPSHGNFDDVQCGEPVRYVAVFPNRREARAWFDAHSVNVCIVPFTKVKKSRRGFYAMKAATRNQYA